MAKTNVRVSFDLEGREGNAYFIIAKVCRALRSQGYDNLAVEYRREAQSGNYKHLLAVTQEYVIVE